MTGTRPVVVGVDFSPSSQAAVEYAVPLAAHHDAPLHLIHAHLSPLHAYTGIGMAVPYSLGEDQVVDGIDAQLKQAAEDLRHNHLRVTHIDARRVEGNPASILIDASREAMITVVGCRGVGGFAELLLGSVSAQVAAHAHGPVIVLRPPVPDNAIRPGPEQPHHINPIGPVLVGYDGSPAADAALEFAAREAHTRNTTLMVANVYWAEPWQDTATQDEAHAKAEQLVAHSIQTSRERYPALDIQARTILAANPEHALTDASRDVALTVVGCRGRDGFAGMLLGSVSHTLVHHAHRPVAVIHPAEH